MSDSKKNIVIIFYYNKSQPNHVRLIKHLHDTCPYIKCIFETKEFTRNIRLNQRADAIFFAGMIRGEGMIYNWCRNNNKRFFYIDHAYINRGYDSGNPNNEWMRITDSGFAWNLMETRSDERWNKFFKNNHDIESRWNVNKDRPNILILPPSLATQYLFPESTAWLDQTLRILKKHTKKNLWVREKPIQTKLDGRNNLIGRIKFNHEKNIEQELEDAAAVVTFNSAVAVQAIMRGIPAASHASAVGAPVSFNLNEIDNPPEPKREAWLHQLVYHQFRTTEMIDGSIWPMLMGGGMNG